VVIRKLEGEWADAIGYDAWKVVHVECRIESFVYIDSCKPTLPSACDLGDIHLSLSLYGRIESIYHWARAEAHGQDAVKCISLT
jgi:hypothetical protein